jgi:hypothetical protein
MRVGQSGTLQGELRIETVEFNVPLAATLFTAR